MGNYPVGQRGPAELADTPGQPPESTRMVLCNGRELSKCGKRPAGMKTKFLAGPRHKTAREVKDNKKAFFLSKG